MKQTSLNEKEEMFLERVWRLRERNDNTEQSVIDGDNLNSRLLLKLVSIGYLVSNRNQIQFSAIGEDYTCDLIRRKRLTELLLFNILNLNLTIAEQNACKIEHTINGEVTESICAFLGHPKLCPHGKPIPPGSCCFDRNATVKPLIEPLKKFVTGERGRIVFVEANDNGLLNRLTSLGLYPGAVIAMRQHKPTTILRVGETDIALEPELANRIYCRFLKS